MKRNSEWDLSYSIRLVIKNILRPNTIKILKKIALKQFLFVPKVTHMNVESAQPTWANSGFLLINFLFKSGRELSL